MSRRTDIPDANDAGAAPGGATAPAQLSAGARRHEAGRLLLAAAPAIVARFSQERTEWRGRSAWRSPLLEQAVLPLLLGIGRELQATMPQVANPWTRCPGLLRLSTARGARALVLDLTVLRRHALGAIAPAGSALANALVEDCLDIALEGALGELARVLGKTPSRPTLPFGGVILELFEREPPPDASASRRQRPTQLSP